MLAAAADGDPRRRRCASSTWPARRSTPGCTPDEHREPPGPSDAAAHRRGVRRDAELPRIRALWQQMEQSSPPCHGSTAMRAEVTLENVRAPHRGTAAVSRAHSRSRTQRASSRCMDRDGASRVGRVAALDERHHRGRGARVHGRARSARHAHPHLERAAAVRCRPRYAWPHLRQHRPADRRRRDRCRRCDACASTGCDQSGRARTAAGFHRDRRLGDRSDEQPRARPEAAAVLGRGTAARPAGDADRAARAAARQEAQRIICDRIRRHGGVA